MVSVLTKLSEQSKVKKGVPIADAEALRKGAMNVDYARVRGDLNPEAHPCTVYL